MSIDASALMPDATALPAPTGGTSVNISATRNPNGKVIAHFDAETDFLSRTTFEFATKDPVANASLPGGYTQAKESVFIKVPFTLANGNRTHNTITTTVSRDPEWDYSEAQFMRLLMGHILGASGMVAFWQSHNMS